jgi:MFS family permease
MVMAAACAIAMLGFGARSVFGLFLEPMTSARGWGRETFALALAIQNLMWGVALPFAGALSDRFGSPRVLALGALIYAGGIWGMTAAEGAGTLYLTAGVLVGVGVAFTAFSIALAAMAKVVGPERRSLALGLGTAAGSSGQVVFSPLGQAFISAYGWQAALLFLAASALLIAPLAFALPGSPAVRGEASPACEQSLPAALREAFGHRGYALLTTGFFVCGFHVAFITVHFPAYVRDLGLSAAVGAGAIAVIGLFNILGSFASGAAGQRWSKKCGLSTIYASRAVAITALMLLPKTAAVIYLFAAVMGVLWLSTVPLTTGIVGQVFGVRYLATLFGVVFLSHQLGSFLGVWLGGWLYDTTGSYDGVWWAGVALGLAAALIHLPIDERPIVRRTASASAGSATY